MRNRKDGVSKARSDVTSGIERITCGRAEAHADGYDDVCDRYEACLASEIDRDAEDTEDEYEGGNDLAEEIVPLIRNGWSGTEDAKLSVRIFGSSKMIAIEKPDKDRATEASKHLRDDVARNERPIKIASQGEAYGECRIEMRSRWRRDESSDHHGKSPTKGDKNPASAFRFALLKRRGGVDTFSDEDEEQGAKEFEKIEIHRNMIYRLKTYA